METSGNLLETGEGNTNASPVFRTVPCKYWCFTFFPEKEEQIGNLETQLLKCGQYIFGEEMCPTTNKLHLQGFIASTAKIRPKEKFKDFPTIHWEKSKGNEASNIKYCSKDGKTHTNIKLPRKLIDPLEGKTLYKYQQDIMDIIKELPDDRKIHWFWEPNGNKGKTSLCKHICINHNAIVVSGKSTDIYCGIADVLEKKKEIDIVLFNIVRCKEQYISYEAIESIKDGMFFSGKYESGMKLFNPPHIICFANFRPNVDALSGDRWNIVKIMNE